MTDGVGVAMSAAGSWGAVGFSRGNERNFLLPIKALVSHLFGEAMHSEKDLLRQFKFSGTCLLFIFLLWAWQPLIRAQDHPAHQGQAGHDAAIPAGDGELKLGAT